MLTAEFVALADVDAEGSIERNEPGRLVLRLGLQQANADKFEILGEAVRERAQEMVQRRREEGKPIGRPKKLDTEELERVYEWREKGLSYGEIATLAGELFGTDITRQTIYRYCKDGLET